MAIVLRCKCGKALRLSDTSAGKKARCPGCQSILNIPAPDAGDDENVERAGLVSRPKRPPAREDDEDEERPRARGSAARADDDESRVRKRPARDDDEGEPRSRAR